MHVCVVCTHLCVCLFVCVYDCLGSQRVTEPEFDEGTTVVSKGGWGLFTSDTCSVFQDLYFICDVECIVMTCILHIMSSTQYLDKNTSYQ